MGTKQFQLNAFAYTDISEGFATVSFILRPIGQKSNAIRIALATALPAVNTVDADEWPAPEKNEDAEQISFTGRGTTNRVYARASAGSVTLVVYQL